MSGVIDYEKIKKAAQLSVDREFTPPEAGDEDRRYTGPEIAWLDFVSLATPAAVLAVLAEIDQLKAELECAVGDIRTATQIIERNSKDADRYRWLRDGAYDENIESTDGTPYVGSNGEGAFEYKGARLDKLIDADMQKAVK